MLKLIIAAIVIWALLTSGYRAADLAGLAAAWSRDHVAISIR